jgi:hypothetical protein
MMLVRPLGLLDERNTRHTLVGLTATMSAWGS